MFASEEGQKTTLTRLAWTSVQALTISLLFGAGTTATILVFLVMTLVGLIGSRGGVGVVLHAIFLVIAAILMYAVELVSGPQQLTTGWIVVCLVAGLLLALWLSRACSFAIPRLADTEIPAIITAFCLSIRWPQRTASDFLGLLKFEDNAAWVGMVSEMFRSDANPVFSGPAVSMLRSVMAPTALMRFGTINDQVPGDAYLVAGLTFRMMVFLAAVLAGVAIGRLIPSNARSIRIIVSVGSTGMAYVLMGLPLSTGHLTFIGALIFLWALISLTRDDVRVGTIRVILLAGVVAMWWPLAPLGVALLLLWSMQTDAASKFLSRSRANRYRSLAPLLVICVVVAVVFSLAVVNTLPLGFREFFQVKGGLQPLPPNLLPFGLGGAVVLVLWRSTSRVVESWASTVGSLVLYAFALIVIAQFVGPDYSINYSPAKLLLLTAIFLAPFMFCIGPYLFRKEGGLVPIAMIACVILVQGSFVVGWSLNSPRASTPPRWGKSLLEIANRGDAAVFCSTAVPERRLEAYECSRHASALVDIDLESGNAWRHLVLFPEPESPASSERVNLIVNAFTTLKAQRQRVVVLSLDERFTIAESDKWWFERLPRFKRELIQP